MLIFMPLIRSFAHLRAQKCVAYRDPSKILTFNIAFNSHRKLNYVDLLCYQVNFSSLWISSLNLITQENMFV